MFAGTVVYVYAGTQLGDHVAQGILSPGCSAPSCCSASSRSSPRRSLEALKARKVYAKWPRPARFDRNVVVIGAGSAGLVTAYIAAAVKAKVTLVERHRMGGDCLNTGCVPSKALIRSAKFLSHVRRAKEFGIRTATAEFDFARGDGARAVGGEADRAARFRRALHGAGRRVRRGHGAHHSPWTVEVRSQRRHEAAAHHEEHRHRRRRAPLRAADSRARGSEPAHLRQRLEPAHAARAPRGAGRRTHRLRAHAGLRAARLEGDAGGDAAAHPDPRGPGGLRAGDEGVRGGRRRRAGGPQGEAGASSRTARSSSSWRARAPRSASPSTRSWCAVGRVANTRATAWRNSASRPRRQRTVEVNEYLETPLSQHLRLRRRGRALPVHAHRGAHGLVLRGERALRHASASSRSTTR